MIASISNKPVLRRNVLRQTVSGRASRLGFTLIELLLVMMIIAILAAIVVPKFTGRKLDAQKSAATGDISAMKTALGMYEIDNGSYPTSEQGLNVLITNPGNLPSWHKYMEKDTIPVDPWGTAYIYRCPGTNGKDYDLLSAGPDKAEGTADDIQ